MKAKLKAFFKKNLQRKILLFFRLPGYFYVTIDMLYCQLESFSSEGSDLSASFATTTGHDVKPGETVIFTFDAGTVNDFENIEPRVFAAWHAHDIKEGYDTAY